MRGMIQVYTGNGKGKTTAALGLALRAAGAGKQIFIAQFLKQGDYSEVKALAKLSSIKISQFGQPDFIKRSATEADRLAVRAGLETVKKVLTAGEYDLVILDEANIAINYNFFTVEDLISILELRQTKVEVIITGRGAEVKLIEYADLVTEMQAVKHYYQQGITARLGIEK
ncbi:cob(I)yrinic acid a,c-diamide adenosyltransferase [Halanaerobium salsuginis]|jgi:cob(I)alamin adenosyltransferase|uniref:Cob(I)alamin adenosyltransferase n=1 Tax=Halanaerobium salsuginis TaxID=29563 RepID=A0A1I4K592_9FIRM|nr:cob(I)yrinic acid a,c-diamide adenosyltransferase [Halanaerobium salsuginis]SFL73938.1 cob(I)alamin adenosyltransferase [Halanaerobium salsuginis]